MNLFYSEFWEEEGVYRYVYVLAVSQKKRRPTWTQVKTMKN